MKKIVIDGTPLEHYSIKHNIAVKCLLLQSAFESRLAMLSVNSE